jgi:hypothetical protein
MQKRQDWPAYYHYEQVYRITNVTSPLIIQVSPSGCYWVLKFGDEIFGCLKYSNNILVLTPKSTHSVYFHVTFTEADTVVMEAITGAKSDLPLFHAPFIMRTRQFRTYLSYLRMPLLTYLSYLPDYYGRHEMVDMWRRSGLGIMTLKFMDDADITWTCNDYRYFSPELKRLIGALFMLRRRSNCILNRFPRVLLPSIIRHIV